MGDVTDTATRPATAAFIARWSAASGSERTNQIFVTELCGLLGMPKPDPAREAGVADHAARADARRRGVLTTTPRPIALEVIESSFTGRGPWKCCISQVLDALAALGRARGDRVVDAGVSAGWRRCATPIVKLPSAPSDVACGQPLAHTPWSDRWST
jgi:hypothetical protein